jgi:hypothetical protein
MPDLANWVAGASAVKTAFDTLKSAIGLVKEAKDLLPEGHQREKAIAMALDSASTSAKIAEAELAKALGYELCKCQFPPTAMLTIGHMTANQTPATALGKPVFECPRCGRNTQHRSAFKGPSRETKARRREPAPSPDRAHVRNGGMVVGEGPPARSQLVAN